MENRFSCGENFILDKYETDMKQQGRDEIALRAEGE